MNTRHYSKISALAILLLLLSVSVSANPHPITYEKGRSLDINDYDVESIRYNGPFWDPNLNVRAFNMGGEGRLIRSKIGVNPILHYPVYYYGSYHGAYPMRYDYPYGYQRFYGYNYQRYNSFGNCPSVTYNQGFYSNTYIDCGQRYYSY